MSQGGIGELVAAGEGAIDDVLHKIPEPARIYDLDTATCSLLPLAPGDRIASH